VEGSLSVLGFDLPSQGTFVGRVWQPGVGPLLVHVKDGDVVDITTAETPTMRDLLEHSNIVGYLQERGGKKIATVDALAAVSHLAGDDLNVLHVLAPCDLQAVKACGVTFAKSMIERVIEERAGGDPAKAAKIREKVSAMIGGALSNLKPGSGEAENVKKFLIAEGLWSQYLEVGIGPYAEVFTKAQPMSAVGWGARVGLHPVSNWNNPEPEVVLVVNSSGQVVGATLGNDVNLRDVEGRSALLLGKAKDNNASAAIGPFIRVFDETFSMEDVRKTKMTMTITGLDGFELESTSSMSEISRDPHDLVSQTCGAHHQYPDGFMLYLGSMFAPVQDRGTPGSGFTHKIGDEVVISSPAFGSLRNHVALSTECKPWTFGYGALMRNLTQRDLI
jgi:fumarylacetoacetate (FAA) hydrolase family protein